jgi:hypothetical protein
MFLLEELWIFGVGQLKSFAVRVVRMAVLFVGRTRIQNLGELPESAGTVARRRPVE